MPAGCLYDAHARIVHRYGSYQDLYYFLLRIATKTNMFFSALHGLISIGICI